MPYTKQQKKDYKATAGKKMQDKHLRFMALNEALSKQDAEAFANDTVSRFEAARAYDGTGAPKTEMYRWIMGEPERDASACLQCSQSKPLHLAEEDYCSKECRNEAAKARYNRMIETGAIKPKAQKAA